MSNNEPAEQKPKHSDSGIPVQTDLIVAESGNFIIEAVPTPTETRINPDAIAKPPSMSRKTRPGSIKIFPFDASRNDPPIKSAPLRYASQYSPHGYPSRRAPAAVAGGSAVPGSLISPLTSRFVGGPSYQQQQRQQPYQHQQQFRALHTSIPQLHQLRYMRKMMMMTKTINETPRTPLCLTLTKLPLPPNTKFMCRRLT